MRGEMLGCNGTEPELMQNQRHEFVCVILSPRPSRARRISACGVMGQCTALAGFMPPGAIGRHSNTLIRA